MALGATVLYSTVRDVDIAQTLGDLDALQHVRESA